MMVAARLRHLFKILLCSHAQWFSERPAVQPCLACAQRNRPSANQRTASGRIRCSCSLTRAVSVSTVSPGSTGTQACRTAGPLFTSGVTKCTVAPCSTALAASACSMRRGRCGTGISSRARGRRRGPAPPSRPLRSLPRPLLWRPGQAGYPGSPDFRSGRCRPRARLVHGEIPRRSVVDAGRVDADAGDATLRQQMCCIRRDPGKVHFSAECPWFVVRILIHFSPAAHDAWRMRFI